jgi:hypothetical protein
VPPRGSSNRRRGADDPDVCNDAEVTDSGDFPDESTVFEVRLNRRRFRRNVLFIVASFLAYVALAVFASGPLRYIGLAGAVVFGLMGLIAGIGGELQIRRDPVAVTLDHAGVTFRGHDPVSWEGIREVRLQLVRPRLLFWVRPLHCIAFLPVQAPDVSRLRPRERLAVKMYGTHLVFMTETVTPSAEDILSGVERLSDVPVRR